MTGTIARVWGVGGEGGVWGVMMMVTGAMSHGYDNNSLIIDGKDSAHEVMEKKGEERTGQQSIQQLTDQAFGAD